MKTKQYEAVPDDILREMLSGKQEPENEADNTDYGVVDESDSHRAEQEHSEEFTQESEEHSVIPEQPLETEQLHGSILDVIKSRKNQAAEQAQQQKDGQAADPILSSLHKLIDSRKSGGSTPDSVQELIRRRKAGIPQGSADPRDVIFKRKFNHN